MLENPPRCVFAGLATLDVIHRVEVPPAVNEKVTATQTFLAAGGPAANAAVTFASLGGYARLISSVGDGVVGTVIKADLESAGVEVIDVSAGEDVLPPLSSVLVVESTGDRSVVGTDRVTTVPNRWEPRDVLADADILLVDGHHADLALPLLQHASVAQMVRVLDAGRWRPAMPIFLSASTDVVLSADFRVPGSSTIAQSMAEIGDLGVQTIVATAGSSPVQWRSKGAHGTVPVPAIQARDTLGAGDVFHGAYAFARASHPSAQVAEIVSFASRVAAVRCEYVGPRSWVDAIADVPWGVHRD